MARSTMSAHDPASHVRAEAALRTAVDLEPDNLDFLTALAEFYLKRAQFDQAAPVAERMMAVAPENPIGARLRDFIEKRTRAE